MFWLTEKYIKRVVKRQLLINLLQVKGLVSHNSHILQTFFTKTGAFVDLV